MALLTEVLRFLAFPLQDVTITKLKCLKYNEKLYSACIAIQNTGTIFCSSVHMSIYGEKVLTPLTVQHN